MIEIMERANKHQVHEIVIADYEIFCLLCNITSREKNSDYYKSVLENESNPKLYQ